MVFGLKKIEGPEKMEDEGERTVCKKLRKNKLLCLCGGGCIRNTQSLILSLYWIQCKVWEHYIFQNMYFVIKFEWRLLQQTSPLLSRTRVYPFFSPFFIQITTVFMPVNQTESKTKKSTTKNHDYLIWSASLSFSKLICFMIYDIDVMVPISSFFWTTSFPS